MNLNFFLHGLELLPPNMGIKPARHMLLTIGLNETGFRDRIQIGARKPAVGFWQFEDPGILQVLGHPGTGDIARSRLNELSIDNNVGIIRQAITYNDDIACIFARLLLWQYPHPLPNAEQPERGWDQYLKIWKPGKPHSEPWYKHWIKARKVIYGD